MTQLQTFIIKQNCIKHNGLNVLTNDAILITNSYRHF
jgi:hypothetical protein